MRALPALALLALLALPAAAHQQRVARTATATARVAADGAGIELDVLLWLRFAGPRAKAFRARFDLDRSGRFEAGEAALAGDALAAEAIGGFFVRFDGAGRAPDKAEARARIGDADGIEVAVLLGWSAAPAASIELAARAGRDRAGAPVLVGRLDALPPLRVMAGEPATPRASAGPAPLMPGGPGLAVKLTRIEEAPR